MHRDIGTLFFGMWINNKVYSYVAYWVRIICGDQGHADIFIDTHISDHSNNLKWNKKMLSHKDRSDVFDNYK